MLASHTNAKPKSRLADCVQCGVRPAWKRQRRPWQLTCPSCGRTTAEHRFPSDACLDWNDVPRQIERLSIARYADVFLLNAGDVERVGPGRIRILSPVVTAAPPSASARVSGDVVHFYAGGKRVDRAHLHSIGGVRSTVLVYEGQGWTLHHHGVRYVFGQWCQVISGTCLGRSAMMVTEGLYAMRHARYRSNWLRLRHRLRFAGVDLCHRVRAIGVRISNTLYNWRTR